MTRPDQAPSPHCAGPATSPVRGAGDALAPEHSVAGEEDPGAALDAPTHVPPPAPGRSADAAATAPSAQGAATQPGR